MSRNTTVIWDVMPHILVKRYQGIRDKGNTFLRNVRKCTPKCTASHPRNTAFFKIITMRKSNPRIDGCLKEEVRLKFLANTF